MNSTIASNHHQTKTQTEWNAISKSILKSLIYYNIFHFPLSKDEILRYCPEDVDAQELQNELQNLISERYIYNLKGYFSVSPNPELVVKREIGHLKAHEMLTRAKKHIKWISTLPFVECICISGSLSKLYADDSSDVDYFVVTKPNRLWIFRTFTGIAAKILKLIGKFKYMCPNYIIASDKLTIENKNVFSAIELRTLIPVFGIRTYHNLIENNGWIKQYFPSPPQPNIDYLIDEEANWLKKLITKLNVLSIWDRFDAFLFNAHRYYYSRKFKNEDFHSVNYSISHFKMHISKHRHKILTKYEELVNEFEQKHSVDLEAKY